LSASNRECDGKAIAELIEIQSTRWHCLLKLVAASSFLAFRCLSYQAAEVNVVRLNLRAFKTINNAVENSINYFSIGCLRKKNAPGAKRNPLFQSITSEAEV